MKVSHISISIIIPVYNVKSYIERCLESVTAQDWNGELECIVVDDCGTDSSMEIVEQFVSDYSGAIHFTILHHTCNRGQSAARNTAMEAAVGEYIFFLDSDDWITSDCVRVLASPLQSFPYDMIVGNYRKTTKMSPIDNIKSGGYDSEMVIVGLCSVRYHISVWNKLYKKSVLRKYGISFLEGVLCEDVLYSCKVASVFRSMYVIEDVTYIYTVREHSTMASMNRKRSMVYYHRMLSDYVLFWRNNELENKSQTCEILRFIFRDSVNRPQILKGRFLVYFRDFFSTYITARKIMNIPGSFFIRANGRNLKNQILDFHCLLHPSVGVFVFGLINVVAIFVWHQLHFRYLSKS